MFILGIYLMKNGADRNGDRMILPALRLKKQVIMISCYFSEYHTGGYHA